MTAVDGPLLIYEIIFTFVVSYFLVKLFGFNHLFSILYSPKPIMKDFNLSYPKIYPPQHDIDNDLSSSEVSNGHVVTTSSKSIEKSSKKNYRIHSWLENLTSYHVKNWVNDQNHCFQSLLAQEKYAHHVRLITQKHQKYFGNGIKIVYTPFQRGKFYFYFKKDKQSGNNTGESQPSLYCAKDIRQEGRIVLDTKQLLFQYGIIVKGTWISDDGYKMAYGISEWYKKVHMEVDMHMTIYVRDVISGEDSELDVIQGCRADCTAVSWLEGHIGFFYTRYYYPTSQPGNADEDHNNMKYFLGPPRVYFHRMRTTQDQDLLMYEEPVISSSSSSSKKKKNLNVELYDDPTRILVPIVTPDGHYLLIEDYNLIISNSIPICQQSLSDEMGSSCPGNRIHYRKLGVFDGKRIETVGPICTLIDSVDYRFDYIVNILDKFWFRTNYLAPGFRVVQIFIPVSDAINNMSNSSFQSASKKSRASGGVAADSNDSIAMRKKAWTSGVEYIPEHREGGILIRSYIASKTVILLQYLIRGSHEVMIFDLSQATAGNIPLTHPVASLPHPQFGAVTAVHCSYHTNAIFYEFSNLSDPCSVYRAIIRRSPTTGFVELSFDQLCRATIPGIDLFKYDLIQEQITDLSETCQIPIILFGHQDTLLNRDPDLQQSRSPRPCLLFAYGGYGISCMPKFSLSLLLFIKTYNAIVCIVHTQGGGECGRVWHARGYGKFKYRAIDDVVAVAEYLIEKKYTSPSQLTLYSGALGGIVCARTAMRRPDLFAAVVIEDGIFDLVNYPTRSTGIDGDSSVHDDVSSSIYRTPATIPSNIPRNTSSSNQQQSRGMEDDSSWIDEVGDVSGLSATDEDYQRVLKLSPLHNVHELFQYDHQLLNSSDDPTIALSMAASISKVKFPRQSVVDGRIRLSSEDNRASGSSNQSDSMNRSSYEKPYDASTSSSTLTEDDPEKKDRKMTPPAMLLCTSMESMINPSHTFKLTTELQRSATAHNHKNHAFMARIEVEADANIINEAGDSHPSYSELYRAKCADMLGFIAMHTNATAHDD